MGTKHPDPDKARKACERALAPLSPEWRKKILLTLCVWHDLHREVQLTLPIPGELPTNAADQGIDVAKRPLADPSKAAPWEEQKPASSDKPPVMTASSSADSPFDPFANLEGLEISTAALQT